MSTAVLVGLLSLQIPGAWAHAQTTSTFPKNNSVLTTMPSEVWFEFDGNLTVLEGADVNRLLVQDSSGKQLQRSPAIVAGARIIATITNLSASGKITASYRVVSEDGHPVEGSIIFTVLSSSVEATTPAPHTTTKSEQQKNQATPTATKSATPTATKSATPTDELSPEATQKAIPVDEHLHHNFLQRHTDHFIQFGVGFAVIGLWFIYDRRRKK